MNFKDKLRRSKKMFLRFWRSENNKVSIVRDVFVALLFVFIILLALWTYTGQWFGAPLVAIESGSMQHLNEPFGRIGTINAGDMVLLVNVDSKDDVIPYSVSNYYNYGKKGDVIVFHPDGKFDTDQIIHRAMCWIEVEIEGSNTFYTIEEYGIIKQNASIPLYIPDCGIANGNSAVKIDWFTHSGFITKGDNPITNKQCDQIGGISNQPIKIEWISGKASGELPWVGTINLIFNDVFNDKKTLGNVPEDCLICFIVLIVVLISIPVSMDIYGHIQDKKQKNNKKTLEETINKNHKPF